MYLGWTEEDGNYPARMMVHLEVNNTYTWELSNKFQPFNDFSYIMETWQEPQISSYLISNNRVSVHKFLQTLSDLQTASGSRTVQERNKQTNDTNPNMNLVSQRYCDVQDSTD